MDDLGALDYWSVFGMIVYRSTVVSPSSSRHQVGFLDRSGLNYGRRLSYLTPVMDGTIRSLVVLLNRRDLLHER